MVTTSNFFDDLIFKLSATKNHTNLLVNCLGVMMEEMNISIDWQSINRLNELTLSNIKEYEKSLGIILYSVPASSWDDLVESLMPTLIQADDHQLYVLVNNKIYNPASNQFQPINTLKIYKAWQCGSINFPLASRYKNLLKSTLWYFKKNMLMAVLLGFIVSLSSIATTMMSGYIFNHIDSMADAHHSVIFLVFLSILMSISMFTYVNDIQIKRLNVKTVFFIMPSLLSHILHLPLRSAKKFVSGDLVHRFFEYETALSSLITTSLSLIMNCIALMALFAFMLYCNHQLAFFYMLMSIIFTLVKVAIFSISLNHLTKQQEEQCKQNSLLNEILLQINVIRSANIEKTVFNKWLLGLINIKLHAEQSNKVEIFIGSIESLMPTLVLLIFYVFIYFSPNTNGSLTWLQFMVCTGQFAGVFEKVSSDIISLLHIKPKLNSIATLVDEPIERNDVQERENDFKGNITFSNVSFRHVEAENYIVNNICMNIRQGQFVAIIGPSGAGKSTLLRLLLGFESPSTGAIMIDDVNIQNMNISSVRKDFGVVLQTSNLLPGTIFSNIAANVNITLEQAWQLAKMVGLDGQIRAMPMQMQTYISDNAGESLSGGQKQKILIARALATNPKVLLLDEATSALDNASQSIIHESLAALNITRIVVAHRLSTIMTADNIYLLEKGKVLASGSYAELTQKGHLVSDTNFSLMSQTCLESVGS